MVDKLIVMNLPHPAKFAEGLRTPQQLLRSWYIFLFQLPVLPELLIQLGDYQVIAAALTATINYYRNIASGFLDRQNWSVLQVPTLMIWGENDVALGQELTYGTADYVRDFHIHYIPNCSHWVNQERPQLVNRYMRDFLASKAV
jgi:pimeloyl-ACP methyl ester carboxylesterase